MNRSEINRYIREALAFFDEMKFKLPAWGYWSPDQWKHSEENCNEVVENQLGWDLTDFGSGNFKQRGLLLFTLRNGNLFRDQKSYAEKIMIVDENQETPMHFHWSKMEDIINRGGGNLMIQLYQSDEEEKLADHEFKVGLDGIERNFRAGDLVRLMPGDSITLSPGLYHKFYGEPGCGRVMVGEVSSVNDDHSDNHFLDDLGRFPDIIEDEEKQYLLVGDYGKHLSWNRTF